VDLDAIAHNIRMIRTRIGQKPRIMAVVKADAYGHGALEVSKIALKAGASYLGVAIPEEGQALREGGISAPILIFGSLQPGEERKIAQYDLTQTVFTIEAVKALDRAASRYGKTIKVHIKVDTGMGRIGAKPETAVEIAREILACKGLVLEGVYSHFATADKNDNKGYASFQLSEFKRTLRLLEESGIFVPLKHIANSAAILNYPGSYFDMVRPGIILYGLPPSPDTPEFSQFKPAMTLKTKIAYVKEVIPGSSISYGRTFIAKRRMKVATLPVGYGDGYSRILSNKAEVLIRRKRVPQIGTICMDMCMIDVTDIDDVREGEEVILFGNDISATEIAQKMGTINYEVVCMVEKRVPRIYVEEGHIKNGKSFSDI